MSWQSLATELAGRADAAAAALDHSRRTSCVSAGPPDVRCAERVGTFVWVSGLATEVTDTPCAQASWPRFVLRVALCVADNDCDDGGEWHALFEAVWCAFIDWKVEKCAAGLMVLFDGGDVVRIAEGAVYADLSFRIESGCS